MQKPQRHLRHLRGIEARNLTNVLKLRNSSEGSYFALWEHNYDKQKRGDGHSDGDQRWLYTSEEVITLFTVP